MKARITITLSADFDIDPDNYPGCSSWKECLDYDLDNTDALMMLDMSDSSMAVSGELLGEPDLEPFPVKD